jgi:hypothetical protein
LPDEIYNETNYDHAEHQNRFKTINVNSGSLENLVGSHFNNKKNSLESPVANRLSSALES